MNIKRSFLLLLLITTAATTVQAHVSFGFGFRVPCSSVHVCTPAPVIRHCHAPCFVPVCEPRVSFGISVPVQPRPWQITNETDDVIVVSNAHGDIVIRPYATKCVARTGRKLYIYAPSTGEEALFYPHFRDFSVIENRFGCIDIV